MRPAGPPTRRERRAGQLHHRTLRAWLLAVCPLVLVAGCSHEQPPANEIDVAYMVRVDAPGWDTIVTINGNPAQRLGGTAETREVTVWVRQGPNSIRLQSQAVAHIAGPVNVSLVAIDARDEHEQTLTTLRGQPNAGNPAELEEDFLGQNPVHWTWEDADELHGIEASDRAAILDLLHRYIDALRQKNSGALVDLPVRYWSTASPPEGLLPPAASLHEQERQQAQRVFDYDDYTVVTLPDAEIEWFVGSQVVMLASGPVADPGSESGISYPPLVFAGHENKPSDTAVAENYAFRITQFQFIRRDGRWEMLSL